MGDLLANGTMEGASVYAINTTDIVRNASKMHGCSHLGSAVLGYAMTGALLIASTIKENERLTVSFKGGGPAGDVIANTDGPSVRGYLENPDVFLPLKDGKLDVGGAVGRGNIVVTRYFKNAEPFTGYCELDGGEIASDITKYLYVSEQTPASVALGVFVDKDGVVRASGGYFIQTLPGCDDETLKKLGKNVKMTPYVTQLLELGYGPEKIIGILGRGLTVKINESYPVFFKCRCSRERILAALSGLGRDALEEMAGDEVTEAHCQFCNSMYHFGMKDILGILKNK